MKAIIRKLYHDFRRSYAKLLLCIVAAIISAWGISSVFYSYLMSERDFKSNFSSTVPPDFILKIQSPSQDLLRLLGEDKNTLLLERREVIYARTRKSDSSWMPIVLYGVETIASPRVMKFFADQKIAEHSGIFIEKNGKRFVDRYTQMEIQVPGDTTMYLGKSGFVHDPGMAPSQMDQLVYGYGTMDVLEPLLDKTSQRLLFKTRLQEPNTEDLQQEVDRISTIVKQNGSTVMSVIIPKPGAHPHQSVVDGISFLQKSFGFILFLLGIILLSLILLTWLYPQLTDIGVLKAIGASTRDIFFSYVFVLLSIISTGLLIGILLGYKSAEFYNSFIAKLQNFVPVRDPLPVVLHLYVIIPCLILPLLLGMLPLIKISRATVHEALNKIFYTPHKRIYKVSRALLQNSRVIYGFNNLFRSGQRTLLIIALLTLGMSLYLSAFNLRYSINSEFSDYYKNANYPLVIGLRDTLSERLHFLNEIRFVKSIAYSQRKRISFQLPNQSKPSYTTLKIYSKDFKVSPAFLLKGKLDSNCKNCLFVNQFFSSHFESVPLGTPVDLIIDKKPERFIYSGIYKEIGPGPSMYVFSNQDLDDYKELNIEVKQGTDLSKAAQQLDDSLLSHNIDVAQMLDLRTVAISMENHLKPTYFIVEIMGLFTIVVGVIGILIVVNLSLKERVRELGIMKSLGASARQIGYLFAMEFLMVNLVAGIMGIVAGYGLTVVFCTVLETLGLNLELLAKNDYVRILIVLVCLFLIQAITIIMYSTSRVKKTSTSLLNSVI